MSIITPQSSNVPASGHTTQQQASPQNRSHGTVGTVIPATGQTPTGAISREAVSTGAAGTQNKVDANAASHQGDVTHLQSRDLPAPDDTCTRLTPPEISSDKAASTISPSIAHTVTTPVAPKAAVTHPSGQ